MKSSQIDQSGFAALANILSAEARIFGVKPSDSAAATDVIEVSKSLLRAVSTARAKHGLPPIDLSAWGHSVGLNAESLKLFIAELLPTAAKPGTKATLSEIVESRLASAESECPFPAGSLSARVWHSQRGEREAAAKLQAKIDPIIKDTSLTLTERHNRIKALTGNAA